MKKTAGILSTAFLGLGMVTAAPSFADETQLTEEDSKMIHLMRDFGRCIADKAQNPSEEIKKELRDFYREATEELKAKNVPENAIQIFSGIGMSGRLDRWARETCDTELHIDWGLMTRRFQEMLGQRETGYGQKFFETLDAPEP